MVNSHQEIRSVDVVGGNFFIIIGGDILEVSVSKQLCPDIVVECRDVSSGGGYCGKPIITDRVVACDNGICEW